jgi:hypothetical protein
LEVGLARGVRDEHARCFSQHLEAAPLRWVAASTSC